MFGLPADVDVSFLVGAVLIQVCAGENEVVLNFDEDVSIMSAATIRYAEDGEPQRELEDARTVSKALIDLLGQTIVRADGNLDGTLRLFWSNDSRVELLDSWGDYESYTVRHGETLIVV